MKGFLRKITGVDPENRKCEDCEHSIDLHNAKMKQIDVLEEFSFKMERLDCKSYECNQFK